AVGCALPRGPWPRRAEKAGDHRGASRRGLSGVGFGKVPVDESAIFLQARRDLDCPGRVARGNAGGRQELVLFMKAKNGGAQAPQVLGTSLLVGQRPLPAEIADE